MQAPPKHSASQQWLCSNHNHPPGTCHDDCMRLQCALIFRRSAASHIVSWFTCTSCLSRRPRQKRATTAAGANSGPRAFEQVRTEVDRYWGCLGSEKRMRHHEDWSTCTRYGLRNAPVLPLLPLLLPPTQVQAIGTGMGMWAAASITLGIRLDRVSLMLYAVNEEARQGVGCRGRATEEVPPAASIGGGHISGT